MGWFDGFMEFRYLWSACGSKIATFGEFVKSFETDTKLWFSLFWTVRLVAEGHVSSSFDSGA